MLDAFRSMTSGKNKQVQQQTDELRAAHHVSARRAQRAQHDADDADRAQRQADAVRQDARASDGAGDRRHRRSSTSSRKAISTLDERAKEIEQIDRRIQALKDAAKQAELTTQKAIGPDGELQKHREAVQHLSSQALQTQATLDTLKKERAALEEMRGHLRMAEGEVKQATTLASTVKGELDQIRATATSLTQDYGKIRETSREAREDTTSAMTTVKDIEKKLVPLAQLHELSQSTEKRLAALNALAEHVVAQGQGAREPAAGGRTRRRGGQPRQRDGLGDGRADQQAERRA